MSAIETVNFVRNAPIPTWFKVGGRADRLATPRSIDELKHCLQDDANARILGDGANLLVDDDGVGELVISLKSPECQRVEIDAATGRVFAAGGADFAKLIQNCVRAGLGGIEGLIGIPASVGGACFMNAGGAFGQICDSITRVHAMTREGEKRTLERRDIDFSYRHSGLDGLIITGVDFQLSPGDPAALRERLKECMAYKKRTQPMAENSAGCCFKNPTITRDLSLKDHQGFAAGSRVSAGLLIDKAGCKGLSIGAAEVSTVHGNFLFTKPGATARNVIDLMELVQRRVLDTLGVRIEREVVVWRRAISS